MLAAYEAWLAAERLPPVTPWDGVRAAPWDPALDVTLPASLAGGFAGISTLEQLGAALRDRYATVAGVARELNGLLKAPFSYRYWSYVRWARDMRRRFQGDTVYPTAWVYDRDGTPLSATPFSDTYNDMHRSWHVLSTSSNTVTPGLSSTAGQRSGRGLAGMSPDVEFLVFHRDHTELFHRWLARTGQPPVLPQDMGRSGGWPPTGPPPVINPPAPWSYDEASFPTSGLPALTTVDSVGAIEGGYHGAGHGQNTDIGPLSHNNYVPRFHTWHWWIDAQWWWREPRFAKSNATTGERSRVFRPVLQNGANFESPFAVSIVRDPALPADTIWPPNAVGGPDLTTGAGTLRTTMYVRDPLGRTLRLRLTAEVLDAAGTVVPGSTVTLNRTIGPGGDHPLDTDFTEDLTLSGAFTSDDPSRANPAVGFVNGQVRVSGLLWVPDSAAPDDPAQSPDPDFVHEDSYTLDLVREKLGPEVLVFQDLSSFSDDQVAATSSGGVAAFDDAFYVVAQDRTASPVPAPVWPPLVADEVKGLISGWRAASGLFDDLAHAPEAVLWRDTADQPFTGVTVRLMGPPDKEDATLPPSLPQRYRWRYAIDFASGHDAFDGLNPGDARLARLRVTVRDRAGNATTAETPVKLFRGANPYMIDGPIPWLSVDTRVFALREGQTKLGETIAAGQPRQYLAAILNRLNAGTTGTETFEALATEGPDAALEYAESIPDFEAGTSQRVYNFALAKVRLRGASGAAAVRMFFRLFRYAEPSLLFAPTAGYRAFGDGAGRVVPLPGFESETAGAPLRSIPFFAEARADPATASLESQTDPLNVHDFPPGPTGDRVWYFGAWLDFNDPNVRLPAAYEAAAPNGPYPSAALAPLRTLMRDFHQCMVAEIRFDGDPTEPLASPTASDNLAQRNLAILSSANPGDRWTRTVEQAFDLDLSRAPRREEDRLVNSALLEHHDHGDEACETCGHLETDADELCARCGGADEIRPLAGGDAAAFMSSFRFARVVDEEAMSLAMQVPFEEAAGEGPDHGAHDHGEHGHGHGPVPRHDHHAMARRLRPEAAREVRRAFPFVFHQTRWTETSAMIDELMIDWGNLPPEAEARLFLPSVAPESIVSLRNLRHAPGTVAAEADGSLRLDVGGVTYVPLPPVPGDRIAGALTVTLPEGVRAPERYVVDVTQLRAGATVRKGGFRVEIVVRKAAEILHSAATQVELLHAQLAAPTGPDRWRPVLERRLLTERHRARGLAEDAGVDWVDPTVWTDESGVEHPVGGERIRVVLEAIRVLDDRDPSLKGAGEIDLEVLVVSEDNGGLERRTRLPGTGHIEATSGDRIELHETVFEGFVENDLGIRIEVMERDTFDPDDSLGSYGRRFTCPPATWLGTYGPSDERVDPEHLGYWQVEYRIERA